LPENLWKLFLGQERSADGGIHAKKDHNNVRNGLQNTKVTAQGHSEKKEWKANIWCSAPP
jgi:hypothetical protein